MRNIWFTSDTHFGHANIIKHAERPFQTTAEMDEALIDGWNGCVGRSDLVYHLGDFAMRAEDAIAVRPKLRGTIRLIVGNHDHIARLCFAELFQRVLESRNLGNEHPDLRGAVATHRPIFLGPYSRVNVHGHIHQKKPDSPRHINLSVERTDYRPVHLDSLREMVRAAFAAPVEAD